MRIVFVSICLFLSLTAFTPTDINYQHKAISKTLIKSVNMVNPNLIEIPLPDSLMDELGVQGKYFKVTNENSDCKITVVYIGRVNSCRAGGCSISNDVMGGQSEYFDYMVCFNQESEVELVKVFNYQATHGHEVTAKGWLRQFAGHNADNTLEVGKNVDSISGATISVNGITNDIIAKTKLLQQLQTTSAMAAN